MSPVAHDPEASAPYMLEQATCRAHFLVSRIGIPQDGWEDLRQEFVLDCLQRAPGFDPARGDWPAFVRGVIRNRSAIAAHRALKRVECETPPSAWGDFDPEQPERLDFGRGAREPVSGDPTASLVLSADMQRVIAGLSDNLRNLAIELTYLSPVEVAAKSKRSKQRIYQLMGDLRRAFLRAHILPGCYCDGGAR